MRAFWKNGRKTILKNTRRPAVWLLAVLLGGMTVLTACQVNPETPSDDVSGEPSGTESNAAADVRDLAEGCPYFIEYGASIQGDDHLTALTGDGGDVVLKPLDGHVELELSGTDWSGNTRELAADNSCAVLSVDLGCISEVTGCRLDGYEGEFDLYYSTDGTNFSFYLGAFQGEAELPATRAKALQFVIPYGEEMQITLHRIHVYGRNENRRKLLSLGKTYTGTGKPLSAYPDDGTRLTDGKGVAEAGEDTVAGFQGNEADPVTGKSGVVLTLDLGETMHMADVLIGYYAAPDRKPTVPDRITVRVSEDGEKWTDFGQSYLRSYSGALGTSSRRYFVTHPETVDARYVRIFTYVNAFLTDEIRVYGYDRPVEVNETLLNRSAQPSDSNVAAFAVCSFNGADAGVLTDRTYTASVTADKAENEITLSLGKSVGDVCAFSATYTGSPTGWTFKDEKGNALESIQEYAVKAGLKTDHTWFFPSCQAEKIIASFTGKGTRVFECAAYASAAQLPLVRGGFFQIPCGGASTDNASNNSPYSWYLQLKGMKDLGMDYVVIQYGASYTEKTVLFNGKRITGAGYKYTPTYGSEDLPEAVLDAADKLSMKVWLGTIHGANFNAPTSGKNKEQYEAIAADGLLIIEDIQERYAGHKSFAGFYLADEECDQWLNMRGGVEAARAVYKPQSDRIRKLNPNASIMIAPAIWRSGTPENGADNLYRAIKGEDGGKPIVDIVAAQDCLGRTDTLTVSASVYNDFERYCAEWAKAVRRAGAEFWHDTEVFEQTGTAKRAEETIKALGIQAKLSGSVIVFDIPHYMTLFPSGRYDNLRSLYMMRHTRAYAKYYASFTFLDWMGEHARAVETNRDDGHVLPDTDTETSADPGIQQSETHNPDLITEGSEPDNWQPFKEKNGKGSPKFAYSFDSEAFYVAVETGDQTVNNQKGVWWSGEDDLLQIWMMPNGKSSMAVLDEEYGIRFWIHRTATGWTQGYDTGSSKTNPDAFTWTEDNGVFLIRMPWTALGVRAPERNDGTAIGIVLQYIDGEDLTWAASEGTKGPSVPDGALYSF